MYFYYIYIYIYFLYYICIVNQALLLYIYIFWYFCNVTNKTKKGLAPYWKVSKNISIILQKCFLLIEANILTLLQPCRDIMQSCRDII